MDEWLRYVTLTDDLELIDLSFRELFALISFCTCS